jgi:hypothetical protein
MLDTEVDDKDLDKNLDDQDIDKEDEDKSDEEDKDETWKDKQKVPYRRLEAQSRKAQKLEEDFNELKLKFETLTQGKKGNDKPIGTWDNRVKNAQSWDEVFNELPNQFLKVLLENPEMKAQFVNAVKGELKSEDKQVEEKVNREIDALWDKDIITSKDEENRVIKYAIKESEETGEYVPLAVAVRMMKKEGVWGKKIEDRKDANNKIRPGGSNNSVKEEDKSSYNKFRHESIDTIVADAASKFSKN